MEPTLQIQPQQTQLPIGDDAAAVVMRQPATSDGAAAAAPVRGSVQVMYGALTIPQPIAGMTVADARAVIGPTLRVPEGAQALIDGRPVEEGERLASGMTLEFMKRGGGKGRAGDRGAQASWAR